MNAFLRVIVLCVYFTSEFVFVKDTISLGDGEVKMQKDCCLLMNKSFEQKKKSVH